MKKLISAISAIVLCAGLFTACGGNTNTAENSTAADTSANSDTVTAADTEASSEETTYIEPIEEETLPEHSTAVSEVTTIAEDITISSSDENTENEITTIAETTSVAAAPTEPNDISDTALSGDEILIEDLDDEAEITDFEDMEDFLASGIFTLEGKTLAYDKTLSKEFWDKLSGDVCKLKASSVNGSESMVYARSGDKILIHITSANSDVPPLKQLVKDGICYNIDDNLKAAMYMPVTDEMRKAFSSEGMGIVPEQRKNQEYVSADVTIGGEAYTFEYAENGTIGMLYLSDKSLYACVKGGGNSLEYKLSKWELTTDVPESVFDIIPDDYALLDLDELMSMTPPEE